DGGAALRHVKLGCGVEVEEIRTAQVAADEREPIDGPEHERADAGAGGRGITKSRQAHGQTPAHRPLSRRRAKRSGSLAFLMARWAPLMSYRTRRNSKVFSSTSQMP